MELINILKKMAMCLAIAAIVVGAGCGIGMNFYQGQTVAGICCIVLAFAAVPTVVALARKIKE